MTLAVSSEAELRMELWRSFIGVLKAYAALANPDAEAFETSNLDDTPYSVIWSKPSMDGRRRFCLNACYDAQKDKGTWWLHALDEPRQHKMSFKSLRESLRPFSLNPDGTVSIEGSVIDMDHAAIQLMGWFSNAVKTGNTEVAA
jgi:hypothetical protein